MTGEQRTTGCGTADDSRIADVRLRVLRARSDDGIAMSFAPLTHRAMVLIEIETADGRVGYGESWINYPPWAASERAATLREGVFPLLLGQDADRIRQLHATLRSRLGPLGRQWGAPGPIMQAISAADIALWDLAGQAAGVAVSRLAGGRFREEIPVYASSLGPQGVPEQAARCTTAGHMAVKVKLGFGREEDERILAQARTAIGDERALYADANQAWSLPEAVAVAPLLRSYGVEWLEEPLRGDRVADLEALHTATGLQIATGENVYGCEDFAAYAASPAVAILQPDLAKTGGLTECLAVCALARAHDKDVMPHLYGGAVAFAATLQLAAMAPAVTGIEYDIRDNPLRDPLLTGPPSARNGRIALPDLPGLGVHLDGEAVRACTVPEFGPPAGPAPESSTAPAAGGGSAR